jgi:hypothetical protein
MSEYAVLVAGLMWSASRICMLALCMHGVMRSDAEWVGYFQNVQEQGWTRADAELGDDDMAAC